MAKLAVVVALCLVACATALTFEASTYGMDFTEEAMTCRAQVCAVAGGNCFTTDTTAYQCPLNTFANYTGSACTCSLPTTLIAIGATCYYGSTTTECALTSSCGMKTVMMKTGDAPAKVCIGSKMIGDSCTISAECASTRVCTGGVCAAPIALGGICRNSNVTAVAGVQIGQCPLSQYCPSIVSGEVTAVCTNYVAAGASCSTNANCISPTYCSANSPAASPTCDYLPIYTVATGSAPVASTGSLSCVSGLINSTSNLCVGYDTELAKWNTAFPNPKTIACTTSIDCNLKGVALAICVCTAVATGATPYCALTTPPSAKMAATKLSSTSTGLVVKGQLAGCESPLPSSAFVSGYCSYNYLAEIKAAYCPQQAYSISQYICYSAVNLCNGASALQSSIFVTMIVAAIAFFTQQ